MEYSQPWGLWLDGDRSNLCLTSCLLSQSVDFQNNSLRDYISILYLYLYFSLCDTNGPLELKDQAGPPFAQMSEWLSSDGNVGTSAETRGERCW